MKGFKCGAKRDRNDDARIRGLIRHCYVELLSCETPPNETFEESKRKGPGASLEVRITVLAKAHEEESSFRRELIRAGFNITKLAQQYGLSVRQFERHFLKEFQSTPKDFARNARMDLAVHLLKSCDKSLKEIAAELGYRHPADFSRAFKAHYAATPRDLREELVNDSGYQSPLPHHANRKVHPDSLHLNSYKPSSLRTKNSSPR